MGDTKIEYDEKFGMNSFIMDNNGASIITIRAINRAAARLYQSVGFKAY